MKHITKIIIGAAFLIIGGTAVMGNGQKNRNLSAVSDVKRADAAIKTPGPFWTMAPDEQRYINYRKDGLCYTKLTAVEIWDRPQKQGFEYNDPLYELIAFEQEFDAAGNAKYTDVVVPEEIEGVPVINSYSFAGHYELKSLCIRAKYSYRNDWLRSGLLRDSPDSIKGCTGLEHYEMPQSVRWLSNEDLADCKTITSLNIPQSVTAIMEDAFKGCKNLKTITFDKFSNLNNVDGLRTMPWWKEHTLTNGMTIYQKCLVDAGKKGGTITLRGDNVEKIFDSAFKNSKAKTIHLENIKTMSNAALAYNKAQKIVLGKGINTIPEGCFNGDRKLKEIRITSREKIVWGKSMDIKSSYYTVVGLETEALQKNQKIDIYVYSNKLHKKSLYRTNFSAKKVTLHVPAKMVAQYRECVKCKVVAL